MRDKHARCFPIIILSDYAFPQLSSHRCENRDPHDSKLVDRFSLSSCRVSEREGREKTEKVCSVTSES